MPQMFPMNWLILSWVVVAIFFLVFAKFFFWDSPSPTSQASSLSSLLNPNKWMW